MKTTPASSLPEVWAAGYTTTRLSKGKDRPRPEFAVYAPDGSLIGYAETAHGVIALVRCHQRKSITPASAGKGGAAAWAGSGEIFE